MSRNYQAGDTYHKTFPVNDGTGAKVNFDASPAPTATFIRNGVADPTVLTITLLSGKTGAYDVSGTIPGAAGDLIDTYVEGSIGGTPTNGVVESFRVVSWPSNVLPNAAANAVGGVPILDANSRVPSNVTAIDSQATSGNNATLNLKQLNVVNPAGDALVASSTGGNGRGIFASGNGTGDGIRTNGGSNGGSGVNANGGATNSYGIIATGAGSGAGLRTSGGATGSGIQVVAGGTSGAGISITTTAGDGIFVTPTAGHALTLAANGTSKHGINATGGTGGTSDGIHAAAGTGGVDFRGNITGTLSTLGTVWDQLLTATSHNTANSAGQILRLINPNSDVIRSGTAQGGTATTITLDAGASSVNGAYNSDVVSIPTGAGAGGSGIITAYNGTTKVATIDSAWTSGAPDATSTFEITPSAKAVIVGYLAGQDPATQVLDAVATDHATTGTIGADIIAAAAGGGSGSGPTAAEIATAILTDTTASDLAIAGSLGHLIGNAPSWYTAPDNTDIATILTSVGSGLGTAVAAIKTQTDKFLFDASDFVKSNPQASITVGDVTLAADQPNYAPARAGDPMALSDAFLDSAATFRDQQTVTAPTYRDLLQGAYGIYTPIVKDDATGNFNVVSPLDNAVILYVYSADDAIPVNLDAVTIESGVNARQALSVILAACAGTLAGAGTGSIVINGANVSTTRITATTDNLGNRTAITLNVPA